MVFKEGRIQCRWENTRDYRRIDHHQIGKIGSKGIEELLSKLDEDLSFDDAEKIVERAGLTSSANKMWKVCLKKQAKKRKSKEKDNPIKLDMVDVNSRG